RAGHVVRRAHGRDRVHRGHSRTIRYSPMVRRALAAATLGLLLVTFRASPAQASSALELVKIARAHESARQEELALRRYMEALTLDPTCEEAYLGLGSLRTRRGDLREAERVYSVALEHVPQLRAARTARAWVRLALGRRV